MKAAKLRFLCCPLVILLLLCSFAGCVKRSPELYALTDISYVKEMLQAKKSANEPVKFWAMLENYFEVDVTDELLNILDLEHWEESETEPEDDSTTATFLTIEQPNDNVYVQLEICPSHARISAMYKEEIYKANPGLIKEPASRYYRLWQDKNEDVFHQLVEYLSEHQLSTKPQF